MSNESTGLNPIITLLDVQNLLHRASKASNEVLTKRHTLDDEFETVIDRVEVMDAPPFAWAVLLSTLRELRDIMEHPTTVDGSVYKTNKTVQKLIQVAYYNVREIGQKLGGI